MTADDDRTVIRPLGAGPTAPTPDGGGSAAAVPPPAAPAAVDVDEERTMIAAQGITPGISTTAIEATAATTPTQQPAARPATGDLGNGLPVGTRLGEFELTAVVGEGGFGIVYLADDHSLGRKVALKEYMPSVLAARVGATQVQVKSERHRETFEAGRKSFINEARLLAQFDHASLVKVYRFWEANGTAYMVMPFYEGKTLKDTLREMAGPPDEAWLRTLLQPLTEALMVLHDAQCYHRDIAPDNVMMLAGSQRPLLLDFGAARRVIGDMTQALTVILKPGYAPVEQYAEIPGMKQGPWTDVYALAALVHHAITGRTPPPSVGRLVGDTYVPLVQAAAGRYHPGFLAALDHALAVKPDDRTASVAQLRAEMGLAAGGATAAPDTGFDPKTAGRPATTATGPSGSAAAAAAALAGGSSQPGLGGRQRSPVPVIAGAAAGLLLLGIAGYVWLSKPAPLPATSVSAPTPAPAPAPAPAVALVASPAPAAAPVQAPAAPTAAPPSMAALYERILQAQSPGYEIEAIPNKAALRIQRDELSFTITSRREGYLSVQLFGSDGEAMLLYPNGKSGAMKIKAGQPLKLPKAPVTFNTVGPVGPNLLLVMVSAHERDYSALQPKSAGAYRILPSGERAQRIADALPPGRVPAQAGVPICPAGSPCVDDYGAAIMRVDAVE